MHTPHRLCTHNLPPRDWPIIASPTLRISARKECIWLFGLWSYKIYDLQYSYLFIPICQCLKQDLYWEKTGVKSCVCIFVIFTAFPETLQPEDKGPSPSPSPSPRRGSPRRDPRSVWLCGAPSGQWLLLIHRVVSFSLALNSITNLL